MLRVGRGSPVQLRSLRDGHSVRPADLVAEWLRPFAPLFTRPTWRRVLKLVTGALLAPQRRTVTAALRAAGLEQAVHFARYHAVLNRACWSALAVSRVLLALPVAAFASTGPVVIGLDDTIERRWGGRIKARGIYRDPVRSSHGLRQRLSEIPCKERCFQT